MQWTWALYDGTGAAITGAAALTTLRVRRMADDRLLDWNDNTFKVGGWTAVDLAATEVSAANLPGVYKWEATTTGWDDGAYQGVLTYAGGTPQHASVEKWVFGGGEACPGVDGVANAVWDELLTGSTHNITNSAGRRLRQLASQVIYEGVAAGPGTNGNQIELDGGASSLDGAYDPALIAIVAGTGAGQSRMILQYQGSTRVATVDRDWKYVPDVTSEYIIYAHPGREHVNEGLAQGGSTDTITLNASASAYDDAYVRQLIFLRSGQGEDQVRLVLDYDGTSKVATVDAPWDVVPDTTSGYIMIPNHIPLAADMGAAVGAALANYDGPTKAELDSGLAGLHDVSTADVQAAAAAALAAYDPPTKAELDAAVAPLATAVNLAAVAVDLAVVKQVEVGAWRIVANQMIFYAADGTTPLLTFDLYDDDGEPTMDNVFRRVPA